MTPDLDGAVWRKSRRSTEGDCVEVAAVAGGMAVRDSKDPGGAVLRFTVAEWRAFVAGVRDGEFDLGGD
jgi:hypothetical protein